MIKGYLKIAVLKGLAEKSMAGYDLMAAIEALTGDKPSPGSIYPLLKELESKSLITSKEKGKRKEYQITSTGRTAIKRLFREKENIIKQHLELINTLETIATEDEIRPLRSLITDLQRCDVFMMHQFPEWEEFHKTVLAHMKDGSLQKKKEIKRIIADANKKIRGL